MARTIRTTAELLEQLAKIEGTNGSSSDIHQGSSRSTKGLEGCGGFDIHRMKQLSEGAWSPELRAMTEQLISSGFEPNDLSGLLTVGVGDTPLTLLARSTHVQELVLLLDSRIGQHFINYPNCVDETPLAAAIQQNSFTNVQAIVGTGGNALYKDTYGNSMMHWAARYGGIETISFLLSEGCDFRANDDGETPLHLLVQRRPEKQVLGCIELAVQFGCRVNAQNTYGATALHLAYEEGKPEVVSLLMSLGADVGIQNHDGLPADELKFSSAWCNDPNAMF